MTNTLIADKIAQYPQKNDHQIARCLARHGVKAADVSLERDRIADKADEPVNKVTVARPRVKTLADFRRAHDIAQKIRDTVAAIRTDGYVTEEELRQMCEVPVAHWRRHADLPEFSVNKFKLDGTVYWAKEAAIKQMKQITGRI